MAIVCKCISKLRDDKGVIAGYVLQDNDDRTITLSSDDVKDYIRKSTLNVVNLTLTSDGRLVDAAVEKFDALEKKETPEFKSRIHPAFKPHEKKEHNNSNQLEEDFNRIVETLRKDIKFNVIRSQHRRENELIIDTGLLLYNGAYHIKYNNGRLNVYCEFDKVFVKVNTQFSVDYSFGRLNANAVNIVITNIEKMINKLFENSLAVGDILKEASIFKNEITIRLVDYTDGAVSTQFDIPTNSGLWLATVRVANGAKHILLGNMIDSTMPGIIAWNYDKYGNMPFRLTASPTGKVIFSDYSSSIVFRISKYIDLAYVSFGDNHCSKPHVDAIALMDEIMKAFSYVSYNPFKYNINYTSEGFTNDTFATTATVNDYTDDGCDLTMYINHDVRFRTIAKVILTKESDGIRIQMSFNPLINRNYKDIAEKFQTLRENRRPGRYINAIYEEID